MNPIMFRDGLIKALGEREGLLVRAAEGAEGSGLAFGVVTMTGGGGQAVWQICVRAAGAGRMAAPASLAAKAPAWPELPVSGFVRVAALEQALAWAVFQAPGAGDVAQLVRYSEMEAPPAVGYGLRVEFADGSAVFVQLHWAVAAGERATESSRFAHSPTI